MRNWPCLLILAACLSNLYAQNHVHQAWESRYSANLVSCPDQATAIADDERGNVYVTGCICSPPFGDDYFTIKYNAAGAQIWTAQYNRADRGEVRDDHASAIGVDKNGNVYVTGKSRGPASYYDFTTIKYDSAGTELWVRHYAGPQDADDYAVALGLDSQGNVYVTGSSQTKGFKAGYDYVTIKYNSNGVQQWIATYDGEGKRYDTAQALAVDAGGNVYVTGSSLGLATIKYNASGVEQWVKHYNHPNNSYDAATAIAVDVSGNVYVTGYSGIAEEEDYITIKYNNAGEQRWIRNYNGPGNARDWTMGLAVDVKGNVYVTGFSVGAGATQDYATIKYTTTGVQQWVARFNGASNFDDFAKAVAVDSSGNVYVTGDSWGANSFDLATLKYNSSGVEQWRIIYNRTGNSAEEARGLAVDRNGNVYVTGYSEQYATLKYNRNGVQQWVAFYNGPNGSRDKVTALATDRAGNVYVTGKSWGQEWDYATVKYDGQGNLKWVARYNGPANLDDEPIALALDAGGNIYVTGQSTGIGSSVDYCSIKYDNAGVEQWVARYKGPGYSWDAPCGIAVDQKGNIYVAGSSSFEGHKNYVTVKYNASGVEQWIARYMDPASPTTNNRASAIAIDEAGYIYVTGSNRGEGAHSNSDVVTVKYNSAGAEQWVSRYNGPQNMSDFASAMTVDKLGNVYLTGTSFASNDNGDFLTIKYNSQGTVLWVNRYDGPGYYPGFEHSGDAAIALAVDNAGNVIVTGNSGFLDESGAGKNIWVTIKYSATGMEQWLAKYIGPANFQDYVSDLAVDKTGNIYVTGTSNSLGYNRDIATVKYNLAGIKQWEIRYDGSENFADHAVALAIDDGGNIYVTGNSQDTVSGDTWSVFTTLKYMQTSVSVNDKSADLSTAFSLAQNYPNPFNPSTTIRYAIAKPGHVTLKVFNLHGQEIATLVNENKSAGEYKIQWNPNNVPSGVYVYRLQAEEFVETKKLILLQ